jgi:hypothetical protein
VCRREDCARQRLRRSARSPSPVGVPLYERPQGCGRSAAAPARPEGGGTKAPLGQREHAAQGAMLASSPRGRRDGRAARHHQTRPSGRPGRASGAPGGSARQREAALLRPGVDRRPRWARESIAGEDDRTISSISAVRSPFLSCAGGSSSTGRTVDRGCPARARSARAGSDGVNRGTCWVARRGRLPRRPADRLIYATAVEHGSRIARADRRPHAADPARDVW